jgi:hypothetical protein
VYTCTDCLVLRTSVDTVPHYAMQGHYEEGRYRLGRLAASLHKAGTSSSNTSSTSSSSDSSSSITITEDTAMGYAPYNLQSLNTPGSLGRIVLVHSPRVKPVSGVFTLVLGAPTAVRYSVSVRAALAVTAESAVHRGLQCAAAAVSAGAAAAAEAEAARASQVLSQRKLRIVSTAFGYACYWCCNALYCTSAVLYSTMSITAVAQHACTNRL